MQVSGRLCIVHTGLIRSKGKEGGREERRGRKEEEKKGREEKQQKREKNIGIKTKQTRCQS